MDEVVDFVEVLLEPSHILLENSSERAKRVVETLDDSALEFHGYILVNGALYGLNFVETAVDGGEVISQKFLLGFEAVFDALPNKGVSDLIGVMEVDDFMVFGLVGPESKTVVTNELLAGFAKELKLTSMMEALLLHD